MHFCSSSQSKEILVVLFSALAKVDLAKKCNLQMGSFFASGNGKVYATSIFVMGSIIVVHAICSYKDQSLHQFLVTQDYLGKQFIEKTVFYRTILRLVKMPHNGNGDCRSLGAMAFVFN